MSSVLMGFGASTSVGLKDGQVRTRQTWRAEGGELSREPPMMASRFARSETMVSGINRTKNARSMHA